jgi:hypothetical protein
VFGRNSGSACSIFLRLDAAGDAHVESEDAVEFVVVGVGLQNSSVGSGDVGRLEVGLGAVFVMVASEDFGAVKEIVRARWDGGCESRGFRGRIWICGCLCGDFEGGDCCGCELGLEIDAVMIYHGGGDDPF